MIGEAFGFDPAAFLVAARELAQPKLREVNIQGLPRCYRRELNAGDIIDAAQHRDTLKAAGLEPNRKVDIAIGLAQGLCGPQGEAIFDAGNREHIELLISLPWESVRSVIAGDGEGPGPNPSTDGSTT